MRESAVSDRLLTLEKGIDIEIEKPFLSSGHAFVVLDSIKSLNYCLGKGSQASAVSTSTYAWKLAKVSLIDSMQQFFTKLFRPNH